MATTGPSLDRQKILWVGTACLVLGVPSFAFLDRPAAIYARNLGHPAHRVFEFITQFGQSTGYLIISGATFAILYWLGRPWRRFGWSAAFVFVNIAFSGLATDLAKVIFGRARPKLLFSQGLYGFTWFGPGPDWWSFPSGHVTTAVALALSLTVIWRSGWPVWWFCAFLVIASRVIIVAHYPSDLVAAFYVAILVFWATRALFDRYGLPVAIETVGGGLQ